MIVKFIFESYIKLYPFFLRISHSTAKHKNAWEGRTFLSADIFDIIHHSGQEYLRSPGVVYFIREQ